MQNGMTNHPQSYAADQYPVAAASQKHCSSSGPASISHQGSGSSRPTAAADQQAAASATSKKEDLVAASIDQRQH